MAVIEYQILSYSFSMQHHFVAFWLQIKKTRKKHIQINFVELFVAFASLSESGYSNQFVLFRLPSQPIWFSLYVCFLLFFFFGRMKMEKLPDEWMHRVYFVLDFLNYIFMQRTFFILILFPFNLFTQVHERIKNDYFCLYIGIGMHTKFRYWCV